MPAWLAPLIGGAIKAGAGLFQGNQANKWLKNNPFVQEGIPREYLEGQGIANNMANTGTPSQTYNRAMNNIRQTQLSVLNNAVGRRGALSVLPYLTKQTNDAIADLDANDAEARLRNQQFAIGVNNQVGGVKRDLYDKNVRQPYLLKRNEMMQQKGAANTNIFGGIDQAASGFLSAFGGKKSPIVGRNKKLPPVGYGADFDNYGIDW